MKYRVLPLLLWCLALCTPAVIAGSIAAMRDMPANGAYQLPCSVPVTYGYHEEEPQSVPVELWAGYDSATGDSVFASGELRWNSVAYGFPAETYKVVSYGGVLTAELDGELIERPDGLPVSVMLTE